MDSVCKPKNRPKQIKYQNKRKDYVNAFFNVINWKKVNEKFKESTNTTE